MTVRKTAATVGGAASAAGIIACCVAFTPTWEGMDKVAKRDAIGTGHPITYCYGQTDEFGTVRVGQHFTKQECDEKLAESLPHYLALIAPCIHVALPDKTEASLLDASYNAGPAAVCHSPMVAKMNKGDVRGGCNAFDHFAITTQHGRMVVQGLINRRGGNPHEHRKTEKQLCLEGLSDGPQTAMTPNGETVHGVYKQWPKGDPAPRKPHRPAPKPPAARPWYWWIFK